CRDLRVIQAFFAHQQRCTITLGELVERFARQCRRFCPLERERLFLCFFFSASFLTKKREPLATSNVFPRFVAHEIRRDGKEPRTLAHDVLLIDRAKESFLRDFVRPVAVTEPPCQIAHERPVVFAKEAIDVVHAFSSSYQAATSAASAVADSSDTPSSASEI